MKQIKWLRGWVLDLWRGAGPSILMVAGMMAAYGLGNAGLTSWSVLLPAVIGSWAIGLAEDRAEARASKDWAGKFWRLIETDHMLEISVTHKGQVDG